MAKTNGAQGKSYVTYICQTNNLEHKKKLINHFQAFIVQVKKDAVSNQLTFTPDMMIPCEDYSEPDNIFVNIFQKDVNFPIGGFCYDVKKYRKEFLNQNVENDALSIRQDINKIIFQAQSFSLTDIIQISLKVTISAEYTIKLKDFTGLFTELPNIYLQDNLSNLTHDLKVSDYIFTSVAGTFNDRFIIKFQ